MNLSALLSWQLGSLPVADLLLAFGLTLAISALGFRRIDYFVSLGYAFSIAAQTIVFALVLPDGLGPWTTLQLLLLLAYGVRLGSYLIARERAASFARELEASKQRGLHIKGLVKLAIWISVAALYVAMFSPGLLALIAQRDGIAVWGLPAGIVVMVIGLGLESLADAQKAAFKAAHPKKFCAVGLYRIVRCPNYFGEMLFWLGAWISGLGAYRSPFDWLLAGVGLVSIQLISLGAARRLEIKQAERYGDEPAYRDYFARVPVLLPLLPIYSLRRLRVYLG